MTENRISAPAPAPLLRDPVTPPTRVTFVLVPRFNMATLITLIEPLRVANYLAPQPLYQWEILSPDGAEIPASNGLTISAQPLSDRNRRGEAIFALGSWGAEDYANRDLLAWLRRQSRDGARLCAVELGCYLLAKAGLLTDTPIATHWSWAPGFQERYPDIPLVEQLYTLDEPIFSCAGGMAGVDLMLRLIAGRHGDSLAGEVADQMLHQPILPPEAPQRRTLGQGTDQFSPTLRDAIALIEANIADPLAVPEIAQRLGLSQRQLERQFHRGLGCSIVQFGTLVRLQHARVLLIATKLSVREIATATGFNAMSHFAAAFRKCFDRRPSDYRQGWAPSEAAPSWPGTLSAYIETLRLRAARAVQGQATSFDVVSSSEGPGEEKPKAHDERPQVNDRFTRRPG
ncbi:GlxA family transcriptional regulator [Tabrizicola sp.]|uniref:GlxA family transcriptional regulator n=1 Tax=Tabrizicola sp. TaxID=2005166 RepID=UPI0027344765|nr:GlxA family transcriptional regulator [Tabrizicola sp.]MDP3195435.1 GlxA family transcriptional regulator [Tabrizicola sp.]MDZ4066863.1 GlxA family transcriptional regulator [Tabrizicola sp.]